MVEKSKTFKELLNEFKTNEYSEVKFNAGFDFEGDDDARFIDKFLKDCEDLEKNKKRPYRR